MKNKVLCLLIISTIGLNAATSAISSNTKNSDSTTTSAFTVKKQKILENIQQKSSSITALQTCISAATTKTALKECKDELKAAKKANKKDFVSF